MGEIAKSIVVLGIFFIGIGLLLMLFAKIPGMGRLPGDIVIKRENFTFYFPLATCIIISIIITVIMYFFNQK